jgi:hypothetical protein
MSGQMATLSRAHAYHRPDGATSACASCGRGPLAPVHHSDPAAVVTTTSRLVADLRDQLDQLAGASGEPAFIRGLAWGIEALRVTLASLDGETDRTKLAMRHLSGHIHTPTLEHP